MKETVMNIEKRTRNTALVIRDIYKKYLPETYVLRGLNMTVHSGEIYGLLGPSGCGKTTLLRSLVGLVNLDSGFIQLNVATRSEIGYMPQFLCLHEEMSIEENCYFYGYLYGMNNQKIEDRYKKLVALLELPRGQLLIKNLSGGQQKRVSIAVTFIHSPKILILDEPTVGMDPLLIESIWKHFLEMANNGTTIIITTHYIQEAHQAHKIGLMRHGVLLTEKAPLEIVEDVGCTSLEDAFFKLSNEQEIKTENPMFEVPSRLKPFKMHYEDKKELLIEKFFALTYKNAMLLKHDKILTSFILLLPCITMVISNLAIGGNMKNLKIGIINEEIPSQQCTSFNSSICLTDLNATVHLSCSYLEFLKEKTYQLIDYVDFDRAQRDLQKSKITGLLHFRKNYTMLLDNRLEHGKDADDMTLEQSAISTWIISSDPIMQSYLKYDLINSLKDYLKQSFVVCNLNPKIAQIPLTFEEPIYGSYDENFVSYSMNGMMAVSSFFYPGFMSLVHTFTERRGGITERIMVTGISRTKIIASLMVFMLCLILIELIEIVGITYYVFNLPVKGSIWTVFSVLILDGISGLFMGYMLAVIYDNLFLGTFTGAGLLLALSLLTGIMWPIEGMHPVLKSLRWFIPIVETVIAVRDINVKGYSSTKGTVLRSYIASATWVLVFLSITYLCTKIKRKNT